jgi:hypothetical protein
MNYPSKPLLIIAISLVAIVIGIPRVAHADAANPTSTLAVGDWWKYNVQVPIAGLILTGTQTETVAYEANSTSYLWAEKVTASGTLAGSGVTGTWTQGGWGHFRKTDLAEVNSRFTLNLTLVGSVSTVIIYFIFISTNNPPILAYQFPLTVGSQWSMSGGNQTVISQYYYSFNATRNNRTVTNSTNAVYNVLTSPLTTVPAGTFDSYQIRQRSPDNSYTDKFYSPETENLVKQVGYAANGTQLSTMSLVDYSAWPYKSTIGFSTSGNSYNAVIGTDVPTSNIHQDTLSITFQVTGTDGVTGKASIWIPLKANNTNIKVLVDTNPATLTITQNATYNQIIFTFPLSTHTVTVTYAAAPVSFLQQYMLPIIIAAIGIIAIVLVTLLLVLRRKPAPPPEPALYQQPPTTPPTPTESPSPAPPPGAS